MYHIEIALWIPIEGLLLFVTVAATHWTVSFSQTILHYRLGHRRLGGMLYRNHVQFHHTYYSRDHLVSARYLDGEGNNTPYFLLPLILVGGCTYAVLPLSFFAVVAVTSTASFYLHVFFDKEYHVVDSWFMRFAWFRRKQELHFVHHRHANTNFAVIDFFWDRLLGTYREAEVEPSGASYRYSAVEPTPLPIQQGYRVAATEPICVVSE